MTEYKKALDALFYADSEEADIKYLCTHYETIRRALLMADAVEGGEMRKEPPDHKILASEGLRMDGWNDCLEHLRKIGSGK